MLNAKSRFFGIGRHRIPSREFIRYRRWLIAADVRSEFIRARPELAKLRIAFASRFLRVPLVGVARRFGYTLELPVAAEAIVLNTHLRAFYPALGITLKIPGSTRPQSLHRIQHEISSRQNLVPGNSMRAPVLIRSSVMLGLPS